MPVSAALPLPLLLCLARRMKGPGMLQRSYPPAFPLKHQQKDLRLALALG